MTALDWFVVVAFLGGVVAVGVLLSRRASGSMEDFFVSGRNLPWWLAGTSILATSFSSDTPLHTTVGDDAAMYLEMLGGVDGYEGWVDVVVPMVEQAVGPRPSLD